MKSLTKSTVFADNKIGNKRDVKKWYDNLLKMKGKQKRGYEFEKIIYSILQNEKLSPTASYKSGGEQIDGTFVYGNLPFLFEAKWQKKPIPVADIFAFKGKVDGKFHLTSGIFISMGGFSENAPLDLIKGKAEKILLFDKSDLEKIVYDGFKFEEVLKFKIERASFYGDPYVNFAGKETAKFVEMTIKEIIQKPNKTK
ncbi:MAG: restriction endonuclease [Bacteroidetes bacterium]|nr:restriction endonuclease [Bacteroidota bacterium]